MSAIKTLAAARQTDPSAFDRAEPQLLEAARVHAIGDLQRVVGFWRQQVDQLTTCGVRTRHVRGGGCTPPPRT